MEISRSVTFQVKVTYYHPADPGKTSGPVENCYPSEPAEIEYGLYTPNGTCVPYEFFSDAEWEAIEAEVLELHEEAISDAADEAEIDRYLDRMETYQ